MIDATLDERRVRVEAAGGEGCSAEGGKEEIQFRLDAGRALGVLLRFAAGKTDDVGVWGCLGDALGSGWFCAKLVGGLAGTSCFTWGPAPAAGPPPEPATDRRRTSVAPRPPNAVSYTHLTKPTNREE